MHRRTGVHQVHLFTKLGALPLTRSRGFPSPCLTFIRRDPRGGSKPKSMIDFAALGASQKGLGGYLKKWCYRCYSCYV